MTGTGLGCVPKVDGDTSLVICGEVKKIHSFLCLWLSATEKVKA